VMLRRPPGNGERGDGEDERARTADDPPPQAHWRVEGENLPHQNADEHCAAGEQRHPGEGVHEIAERQLVANVGHVMVEAGHAKRLSRVGPIVVSVLRVTRRKTSTGIDGWASEKLHRMKRRRAPATIPSICPAASLSSSKTCRASASSWSAT